VILCVLGSARKRLIFTRIQEGTEPGGVWGGADPTYPNRARYYTPCALMLGSCGGKLGAGTLSAREGTAAVRSERVVLSCGLCSAGLFCVFPLSVWLVLMFPLFAVLLNCPYPNPPVSACFFPFSSASQHGEGGPCGALVAGRSQTITINMAPKRGVGIMAGLSSRC